jgi:hypothetical protein
MTRTTCAMLCAAALFASSGARADLIADLANDWSDASNPNTATFGTWSYLQGSTPLPSVANFTFGGTAGFPVTQPAWAPSNNPGDFLPAEFKARSVQAGVDYQVGDVVVHTTDPANGGSNGPADFRWTSPINGTVTITGDVWQAAVLAGRNNNWTLLVNGVAVTGGTGIDGHDRAAPFDFSAGTGGTAALTQAVSIGTTIDLQITRSTSLGYLVGANLTISAVPEPGSLSLLGLGTATLAFAGRAVGRSRTRRSTDERDAAA